MSDLIGRRINLTDHHGGFTLLTEGGTLWRPGARTGKVIAVTPGRFYQLQENVSWLTVSLSRAHGRYTMGATPRRRLTSTRRRAS